MSHVEIITDSTGDIPKELIDSYDIGVIPAAITLNGKDYRDGIDIGIQTYFEYLHLCLTDKTKNPPTTAAPSPQVFYDLYEERLPNDIISIHIGEHFSRFCASATLAAIELDPDGEKISIVDSGTTSMGIGFMALVAARLANRGDSKEEILATLNEMKKRVHVLAIFPSLYFAQKGGRISHLGTIATSILNIHPILEIRNDQIKAVEMPRTWSQAVKRLLAHIPDTANEVAVIHGGVEDQAEELAYTIRERIELVQIVHMGAAIGAHAGPGAIGIAFH